MQQVEKSNISSPRIVSRAVLCLLFMVDPTAVSHSDAVKNRVLARLPRLSIIHLKVAAQAKILFGFQIENLTANGMSHTDPLVCKSARCLPSVCLLEADES